MSEARFNLRKNVLYQAFSFAVGLALTFLTYRILIDRNGIEAVGTWSTLIAWTALVRIGDAGMANATVRFVGQHDIATDPEIIRVTIETGILANTAIFAILNLLGWLVLSFFLPDLVTAEHLEESRTLLPWLFLISTLANMTWVILGSLQGLHAGYVSARLTVAGNVLQLLLALVLIPSLGLLGLAWSQVAMYAALSIVGWFILRARAGIAGFLPYHFGWQRFREMLTFSVAVQVNNGLSALFEPMAKILVSRFGGAASQGLFELAYKTVSLPRNMIVTGVYAAVPALTFQLRDNPEAARTLYDQSRRHAVRAALGAMICVALFGAPIASWMWMGHLQADYWVYVVLLALGTAVSIAGAPAYFLGQASGKMIYNIVAAALTLAVSLPLGLLGGMAFGVTGVIAALSVGIAFSGAVIKMLNERILRSANARA